MVQFLLPDVPHVAAVSSANAAAMNRLRYGPHPRTPLTFVPGRAQYYLRREEGEVGQARAVVRYLVARLIALQRFVVLVPASAVHKDGPASGEPPAPATEAVTADPAQQIAQVPNRFQLAAALIKGTLRTAYPQVCADVFIAEAARMHSDDAVAYANLSIAELVLTQVAAKVDESVFAGALCALLAHGVTTWSSTAETTTSSGGGDGSSRTRQASETSTAAVDATDPSSVITRVPEDVPGEHSSATVPEVVNRVPRSVAQACWSLHRAAVYLSVEVERRLGWLREGRGNPDDSEALSDAGSDVLSRLCTNLHHLIATVHFYARVGVVPSTSWTPVESLSCVYTQDDVQYLLQLPLPLPPLHADMTANLKQQSAIATVVRTVALELVEKLSLTDWKWVNMKRRTLLDRLAVFYTPEEIAVRQQFMQWCTDFDELARCVLRDKFSIPALFKVEKLVESRVLAPSCASAAAAGSAHTQLYDVDSVLGELYHGRLRTSVRMTSTDPVPPAAGSAVAELTEEEADEWALLKADPPSARASVSAPAGTVATRAADDALRRAFVGLVNAGNTCFVNSVVQLLCRCRPFICALVRVALQSLGQPAPLTVPSRPVALAATTNSDSGGGGSGVSDDDESATRNYIVCKRPKQALGGSSAFPEAPPLPPTVPSQPARAHEPREVLEEMLLAVRARVVDKRGGDTDGAAPHSSSTSDAPRAAEAKEGEEASDAADLRTLFALVMLFGEMNWRIYRNHATTTSIDMHAFLDALPALFRDGQQHDASEFCKMLLELLDRAEKRWCMDTPHPPTSPPSPPSPESASASAAALSKPRSLVERWFGGALCTRLRCRVCDDVRTSRSAFWDLSLIVPKTKAGVDANPSEAALSAGIVGFAGPLPPPSRGWGNTQVGGDEPSAGINNTLTASATHVHTLPHTNIEARTVYTSQASGSPDETEQVAWEVNSAADASAGQRSHNSFCSAQDQDISIGAVDEEGLLAEGQDASPAPAGASDAPVAVDKQDEASDTTAYVDPCTVTIQHLLWQTADPQRNREVLTGDNQLRCTRCDARTDTDLSTVVLAGPSPPPATAARLADVAAPDEEQTEEENEEEGEEALTSDTMARLGLSVEGVPYYLTLQLQRFAFDRATLSFGKLVQPVAMEEVVLLPVVPQHAPGSGDDAEPLHTTDATVDTAAAPVYVPFRLCAILVHSGTTPYSGHYYTLVRHREGSTHSVMTAHEANNTAAAAAPDAALEPPSEVRDTAEREAIIRYAAKLAEELEAHRVGIALDAPLEAGAHSLMCSLDPATATSLLAETEDEESTAALGTPYLRATRGGIDVTGRAGEGWVMVNDSHVQTIDAARMQDILLGKRGVYSARETAYVLLYERVLSTVEEGDEEMLTSETTLPDFSSDVHALFESRARTSAAPPTSSTRTGILRKDNGVHTINDSRLTDEPHDGMVMGRPFTFFDTGTAGY